MPHDIISDISSLTMIPLKTLHKLTDKSIECICNDVYESQLNGDEISVIDLGIGKLSIKILPDNISYMFIPSKSLESEVKHTVMSKSSPLIKSIEEGLASRILNTYKDLI